MDTPIRWSEKDYSNLKKAVSDFNKKIRKLEKEEGLLYLPDIKLYSETRDKITTRREYNRQLKALQDFMKAGAEELVLTKAGEGLSKWEWHQTLNQKRILERRLNNELASLEKDTLHGHTNFRMGSEQIAEAEDTLKSIQRITKTKGSEFEKIKNRIQTLGVSDYNMKRATIYRDNLIEELKTLSRDNPELKDLYNHFKNITNPEAFYEEVKKSEAMKDFFKWYKNPRSYGNFKSYGQISDYVENELQEFTDFESYILGLEDMED